MVKHRLFLLALLGLTFATHAAEPSPHAHVHGIAKLDVAVDGSTLTLALESPLDSLLGFEHPARNDQEKTAVKTMSDQLHKPQALFALPTAAQCRSVSVTLDSPVLEAKPKHGGDGHADLDGEFVFQCAQPQQLKGMTVQLFKAFTHLRELDVQIASPRGQSAAKLTAQQNQLRW